MQGSSSTDDPISDLEQQLCAAYTLVKQDQVIVGDAANPPTGDQITASI